MRKKAANLGFETKFVRKMFGPRHVQNRPYINGHRCQLMTGLRLNPKSSGDREIIDLHAPRSAWAEFLICVPPFHRSRIPHLKMQSGSFPDVPGRTHRKDAFIATGEQHPFQKSATLIVEEVFIPFVFHKLGYDHDDAATGMLCRKVENELNDGNDDEAVG